MSYMTWLAAAAARTGYPVRVQPGWETRGHGGMIDPRGVLLHHTAGPASGEYPSLTVVTNGRPDLPGPLANLGLGRSGTIYVIAAGAAWHAGTGSWPNIPTDMGNQYMVGIEAESTGLGAGDWTAAQLDAYPKLCAELCRQIGAAPSMVAGHKEYCSPPGRKIDPTGIDMDAFRAVVAGILAGTAAPSTDERDEFDMATLDDLKAALKDPGVLAAIAEAVVDHQNDAGYAGKLKGTGKGVAGEIMAAMAGADGKKARHAIAIEQINTFGAAVDEHIKLVDAGKNGVLNRWFQGLRWAGQKNGWSK